MRVRGGCAILWRQQGVSQIGTSPGRRTIVSDLSLAEQRLLDEFARNLESTVIAVHMRTTAADSGAPTVPDTANGCAIIAHHSAAPNQRLVQINTGDF